MKIGHWRFLAVGVVLFALLCPVRAQTLFEGTLDVSLAEVERVYLKGLQYLARNQTAEGGWTDSQYGSRGGVVSLAVLSMLAHGDDPNTGPYAPNIRRGIDLVLRNQNKETGYMGPQMYDHGFSTLLLAEAYGMVDDPRLGPALEKAVKLIVDSQRRNPQGAWRYGPDSTDADTTVSGALMVGLFAARNAGIGVPDEAIRKGLAYYARCQAADGSIGYTGPGGGPAGQARTAIGCLVMALAKQQNTPEYQGTVAYLQNSPQEGNQYFLYYAAQAFFRMSPEAWRLWNRRNLENLRAIQAPDGSWPGSYGITFSTSASLLSLALNFRFLPIYER